MIFATLIWIDARHTNHVNNKSKSLYSYLKQARFLARSLYAKTGNKLNIFTNRPEVCAEFFAEKNPWHPNLIEIEAKISPPENIRFYAAHHKLSAFKKIREILDVRPTERFLLLDSDVYVNKQLSKEQIYALDNSDLIVYNISDQVFPAYGAQRISAEISELTDCNINDPQWFGGEFISGNLRGIESLIDCIEEILPRYFKCHESLHHVGDEMFTSCAINYLKQESDLKITTGNNYQLCSRHWSRHTDRPLSWHFKHAFIHCPGSKPILEIFSKELPTSSRLVKAALNIYQLTVIIYQKLKKLTTL